MRLVLTLIIVLIGRFDSYGQPTLSKTEILNEFRKNRSIPKLDSVFYDGYHFQARKVLDELLRQKIDTLVVYSVDHPGHSLLAKSDSCTKIKNTYFFWKKNGEYRFKTNDEHCCSTNKFSSFKVINFVTDHFPQIKDEFFMGAVIGTEREDDKIKITECYVDHEGKYAILVLVNGQYNYVEFTDNSLTNDESWFLDYNRELMSFRLFELINGEIKMGR